MPTKPPPPCPTCRRLHCTTHPNKPPGPADRAYRQHIVNQWVTQYGPICPGFGVDPHPSTDLTADHPIPKAQRGQEHQPTMNVLCRSCNARRGGA